MKVRNCRLCLGELSEPKLSFPDTPLANEFLKEKINQDTFPLQVCSCYKCGHYQLNEQIDPSRLFKHYLFVAGTSPVNVEHFRRYAVEMKERFNLNECSKVLDIASNDGTLLQHFKNLGMSVLGIDPATNLAEQATRQGIPTIADFFTEDKAQELFDNYGQFDLITANNVFAHVPDMIGFAKGVKKLLKPFGVFSFEVSYFVDVCDKGVFDVIYGEHTSYHTIYPLITFFNSYDLEVFDVQRIDTHGGSIRVFVCNKNELSMPKLFDLTEDLEIDNKVVKLQTKIDDLGVKLRKRLSSLKAEGKSIAIYGFPAKATTLLYALGIDKNMIDFAVEDNLLKTNTFSPGQHIPILPTSAIYERKPDVLLVLAWNFANNIILNNSGFKGKWIIPLPELREVDA